MSEILNQPQETESNPYMDVLYRLAENMRQYDEVDSRYSAARNELHQLSEKLESIDPELPLDEQPHEFAYTALAVHLQTEKLRPLQAELRRTERSFESDETLHYFLGKVILVESINPEKHTIGTSRIDSFGLHQGKSKWHSSRKGRVENINLGVDWGGSIMLKSRLGNYYTAYPLIDRRADYSPAFRITEI